MLSVKRFLSGKIEMGLDCVTFQDIGRPPSNDVSFFYEDSVSTEIQDKCLVVRIQRFLHFEPDSLFHLNVTYFVKHAYSEGVEKKAHEVLQSMSDGELQAEIMGDVKYYTQDQLDRMSLLIGQITSTFGEPVITPPILRTN